MAKSKNITIINFFGKQLKARGLSISKFILFGSQARGGATAGSDIDIAIVSVDFRGKDIFKRVNLTPFGRTLKIFNITKVPTAAAFQFRHAVFRPA
jgi:predicted nucleotidyltransferase